MTTGECVSRVLGEIPLQEEHFRLIREKVDSAWNSSIGDYGYASPTEVSQRLYDALYFPDKVMESIEGRGPDGELLHASREAAAVLEKPLGVEWVVPERDLFVATVSDTIVRGVPSGEALLPGARGQIQTLKRIGARVIIWSAGDPVHQHHKLASIGLVDPAVAPDIVPPVVINEEYGEPIHVASVIAPDKLAPYRLNQVEELTGNRHIVVVDDRIKNLIEFLKRFDTATALWAVQGVHATEALSSMAHGERPEWTAAIREERVVPLRRIGQLIKTLGLRYAADKLHLGSSGIAAVLDFDGTLVDTDKRFQLQQAAVMQCLQSNNWI